MTDKDIVKALECCISDDDGTRERPCKGCPLLQNDSCSNSLRKYALDLIYRQKEKIKEFDEKLVIQRGLIDDQKAEIERLQKKVDELAEVLSDAIKIRYKEAKSEAITEFAERLKQTITNEINTYYNSNGSGYYLAEDTIEDIDNLVKEMAGNAE